MAQALAEQALWDPPDHTQVNLPSLVCPYESKIKISLMSQDDPTLLQIRILFDVSEVPVLTSSLNGWAFGSGRFLLGDSCLKVRLDPLTNVRHYSFQQRAGSSL